MIDRIRKITSEVESKGHAYFSSTVDRLKNNPSPDAPPTNAPEQPTYDSMVLSLLLQVWDEAKEKGIKPDDPKLDEALVSGLKEHLGNLEQHDKENKLELEEEEAEMKKKITSDDIHDGFDSKVRHHYVCLILMLKMWLMYSTSPLSPNPHQSSRPRKKQRKQ